VLAKGLRISTTMDAQDFQAATKGTMKPDKSKDEKKP